MDRTETAFVNASVHGGEGGVGIPGDLGQDETLAVRICNFLPLMALSETTPWCSPNYFHKNVFLTFLMSHLHKKVLD